MENKKKILLVAHAPEDGWAYIKVDSKYYLLEPPFPLRLKLDDLQEVDKKTIEKSIYFGFKTCNKEFDSLDDVVKYIKNEYLKVKEQHGERIPSLEELRDKIEEVMGLLDENFRRKFIEDVLSEIETLINNDDLDRAEKAIHNLYKLRHLNDFENFKQWLFELWNRYMDKKIKRDREELGGIMYKPIGNSFIPIMVGEV